MRLWDIYEQFRTLCDYRTFTNSSDPYETMGHLQKVQILMRLKHIGAVRTFMRLWDIYEHSDPYATMGHLRTVLILMRLWDINEQFRSL